jgi:hypothetical protein
MIETLGNLGDFLGGIGVIITLLYLVRQLQTNTASVRTATYQAAVDMMSRLSSTLAMDPETFDIIMRGSRDRSSLSDFEKRRFDVTVLSMVRAFENLHFQYRNGAIKDEEWSGWEGRIRSTFTSPGYREWWGEQRLAFCPAFRNFIEADYADELPANLMSG